MDDRRITRAWLVAVGIAASVHALVLVVPTVAPARAADPPAPPIAIAWIESPPPTEARTVTPPLEPDPAPPAIADAQAEVATETETEAAPPSPPAPPRSRRRPHAPTPAAASTDAPAAAPTPTAAAAASATPRRFDLRSRDDASGRVVAGARLGTPTPTGSGSHGSPGSGRAAASSRAASSPARGPGWHPVDAVHVRQLPVPGRVAELTCAATARGVEGTVRLGVQVLADGRVRKVRVLEGIGGGCDEVAVRALRRAEFDPAIGTDGRPVDFEVRYEYAFERTR